MTEAIKKSLAGSKFANASKENPITLDLKKRVTIYATANAPYNKEGDAIQVSEILAAEMCGKGWAVLEKGKPKKEKE
jgi:hypothetical protein